MDGHASVKTFLSGFEPPIFSRVTIFPSERGSRDCATDPAPRRFRLFSERDILLGSAALRDAEGMLSRYWESGLLNVLDTRMVDC